MAEYNDNSNQIECKYCGGDCVNEPEDSEFLCDGFAGDIDGLDEDNDQIATGVDNTIPL